MPTKCFSKRAKFLSRRHVAMLIQLRSGHVPLNHYLHDIGKRNSPLCQECGKIELVFHYLIECRRYSHQRREVEVKLRRDAHPIKALLSNPLATVTLFQIHDMGRFRVLGKGLNFTEGEVESNMKID